MGCIWGVIGGGVVGRVVVGVGVDAAVVVVAVVFGDEDVDVKFVAINKQ